MQLSFPSNNHRSPSFKNCTCFVGTPPPLPLSFTKKSKISLNFNIKSWLNFVQLVLNCYSIHQIWKLVFSLCSSCFWVLFFLSCTVLTSFFFFLMKLPVLLFLSPLPRLQSSTGRLPPSSPCSSSLLRRVCPARQTQRRGGVRVISVHEYVSINVGDAHRTRRRLGNRSWRFEQGNDSECGGLKTLFHLI